MPSSFSLFYLDLAFSLSLLSPLHSLSPHKFDRPCLVSSSLSLSSQAIFTSPYCGRLYILEEMDFSTTYYPPPGLALSDTSLVTPSAFVPPGGILLRPNFSGSGLSCQCRWSRRRDLLSWQAWPLSLSFSASADSGVTARTRTEGGQRRDRER